MSSSLVFPRPVVDRQTFGQAVARLAGAVAIIAWNGQGPEGLLVKAVSLLSTEPPRVLFGVDKTAARHDALLRAETCSLNLLSDDEELEAARYAGGAADTQPFSADHWRFAPDRPPQRTTGAVHLAGFIDQKIDAGSHSLFVVRVDRAEVRDGAPLVYFDRGFRRLLPIRQSSGAQVSAMLEA